MIPVMAGKRLKLLLADTLFEQSIKSLGVYWHIKIRVLQLYQSLQTNSFFAVLCLNLMASNAMYSFFFFGGGGGVQSAKIKNYV
jgi:hypothetical protein